MIVPTACDITIVRQLFERIYFLLPMRCRTYTWARARAFTLVEMWVCSGLFLLLLACASYSYLSSCRNAANSSCLTHLHTIQIALATYAVDNDGNMPPQGLLKATDNRDLTLGFMACLKQFGAAPQIWNCPLDLKVRTASRGLWGNFALTSYCTPPDPRLNLKSAGESSEASASLPQDSSLILFCDQPFLEHSELKSAHGQSINAVFADSHCKAVTIRELENRIKRS